MPLASMSTDLTNANATKVSLEMDISNVKEHVMKIARKENARTDPIINVSVISDGQGLIAALIAAVMDIQLVTSKVPGFVINAKNILMDNFVNFVLMEVMAMRQMKQDAKSVFVMATKVCQQASVMFHLESATAHITLKVVFYIVLTLIFEQSEFTSFTLSYIKILDSSN